MKDTVIFIVVAVLFAVVAIIFVVLKSWEYEAIILAGYGWLCALAGCTTALMLKWV